MAANGEDNRANPWTRPSMFLAIAFLAFALIGGAVVLLKTRHSTNATAAAVVTSPAAVTTATGSTAPSSRASTAASPAASSPAAALPDQTIPVTGPPATWITVATLSLPTSPLYGPKVNDGTVMAGYQHSPTGALFADADNHGLFSISPNWLAVTRSAVADTPGRVAFIKLRAPYGVAPNPSPGQLTQLAGYNFVSYTPDRAIFQLLREGVDGSFTTSTDTMIWQNGDWKILLQSNGEGAPIASAPSADGYVPWKAQY